MNISERQSKMDKLLGVFINRVLYKNLAFCLYLLVALADLAATLSLVLPFQYLPAVVHAHGVEKAHAAYIISATGISSTIGSVISGWLCDRASYPQKTLFGLQTSVLRNRP